MKKFNQIYVEITNACNLSCSFCVKNQREIKFLSITEFEHILKSIKPYTNSIYLHVLGEPLLHPLFKDFIKLADQYQVPVKITTNGILIKDFINDIINSNNIIRLNLSLQALVNLDEHSQNEYLENVINLIEKSKFNNRLYISLRLWNNKINKTEQELKLNNKIMKLIKDQYESTFDGVKIIDHVYISVEDEFIWPDLTNEYNLITSTCLGGKTHLGILSNGNIVLCCLDSLGHTRLGNIFEENFSDVINSEKFHTIRNGLQNKKYFFELCKKCTYRNRFNRKED